MLIRKKYELHGHASGIYCLGPGTQSGKLLSGSADSFLAEWDMQTATQSRFSIKLDAPVYSFTHLSDKNLCIGLSNGHLHVVDLINKTETKHLIYHSQGVFSIQHHTDGTTYTAGGDGIINHWSGDFKLVNSWRMSSKKIRCIRIYEESLLICSGYGVLIVSNLHDQSVYHTLLHEKGSVNCVLALPQKPIVSAGWDGHLYQWQNGQLIKKIPAHNYAIYGMELLADGKHFATASRDKTIKIWDSETLEFCARIDFKSNEGHRYSVNCLYYDNEEKILFSGSDDRKIMAWEIMI